ncbi:MAG: hypothetical protein Q4A66_07480 [Eubacteriales bacterium]|nr:hypothetical protein [Eubacteriales bacterium]
MQTTSPFAVWSSAIENTPFAISHKCRLTNGAFFAQKPVSLNGSAELIAALVAEAVRIFIDAELLVPRFDLLAAADGAAGMVVDIRRLRRSSPEALFPC